MVTRGTTDARWGVSLMPGLPAQVLAAGIHGVGGTNERCKNFALDRHNLAFLQEAPNKCVKLSERPPTRAIIVRAALRSLHLMR